MKTRAKSPDYDLVRGSVLFDEAWYATQVDPELLSKRKVDFVQHYLGVGGRNGLAPSPRFVSAAYLATNLEVARAGLNPLVHYLTVGEAEGRKAISEEDLAAAGFPDMLRREERRAVAQIAASPLFDVKFLRKISADIAKSRLHPALYYVRYGLDERLHPSMGFDADAYLDENPDALERGLAPLLHYVRFGEAAGVVLVRLSDEKSERAPAPAAPAAEARLPAEPASPPTAAGFVAPVVLAPAPTEAPRARRRDQALSAAEERLVRLIRDSPLFDAAWYMIEHREVARLAMDPALHYLRHGGPEGLKPSIYFDPDFYLESGRGGGDNPLTHYLTVGRAQGRRPRARLAIDEPLAQVARPA